MDYLTTHTSLSPIERGLAHGFVNCKKGCTRLAAASDKVYQVLAHGRWFSPASSTTKAGRHDIAEILLKVALDKKKKKPSTGRLLVLEGVIRSAVSAAVEQELPTLPEHLSSPPAFSGVRGTRSLVL